MFHRRWHLFEFNDQAWIPKWMRIAFMDCLELSYKTARFHRGAARAFANWAAKGRGTAILDLASGSGVPIELMLKTSRNVGIQLPPIVLSDLYPQVPQFEKLQRDFGDQQLSFARSPVDATAIKDESLKAARLRSICTALHHFDFPDAEKIIADAVKEGDGIFILEPFQRNLRHALSILFSIPLIGMLSPFFAKKFRVSSFLCCTLVPIVPLMATFDGVVSVLRAYTFDEIEQMFPEEVRSDFEFTRGQQPYFGFFSATYFAASRLS